MMYHPVTISMSKPPSARLMRGYWSFQDLCKSVPKHYTGSDVSPRNLVAVLTGDETAVGGRKVIKANMNDHLFVYFAGHGDKEVLIMPSDYLLKSHLVEALAKIDKQKKFQSMVVYLSACHSACRFEDYKFDNMYMIASAKCEEGSMSTFLYTMFGRAWMMYR